MKTNAFKLMAALFVAALSLASPPVVMTTTTTVVKLAAVAPTPLEP